ncbi:MAG: TadE/TadG family type IV pilus assembly protein [Methyloligellaceae bacterium]
MNSNNRRRSVLSLFRCKSGIAGVEAAMIMPFLIVFIFGCIEFSRSLFIQAELQRAVDLTSRFVMMNPTSAVDVIKTTLTSNLDTVDAGLVSAVEAVKGADDDGNETVQMTVRYSFTFLIPFISSEPMELVATKTIVTN